MSISNAGPQPLAVWIEPWCDELELTARSAIVFTAPSLGDNKVALAPTLEIDDGRLVVWANGPGTVRVTIDGVAQNTGSETIPLSADMFGLPVKSFVDLVFGDQPGARPGGRGGSAKPPWLSSLLAGFRGRSGNG